MATHRFSRPILPICLLAACGCIVSLARTASAGVEILIDGTRYIRNAAQPARSPETLRLEERWRVGGADEEILFGQVIRAVADREGNIYLLDAQLSHVEVFSPDGRHLRTLSREGEGPGEIRAPADLLLLPDGRFGILTRFPGRLVKLDAVGDPAGTAMIGGGNPTGEGVRQAHFGACGGGQIYIAGNENRREEAQIIRTWSIGRFDAEGHELARLFELPTVLDFQRPVMVERTMVPSFIFACAVGPDGRMFTAPVWEDYAIRAYLPDGTLDRVIERAYENRTRTEQEVARIRSVFDAWASRGPQGVSYELMEVAPAVTGLHVAADNHLWVQTSRSGTDRPAGVFLTYDVFDPEGHFIKQVAVTCEGDPDRDDLFFLTADTALLIKGYHLAFLAVMGSMAVEEDDESAANMEMVCFRVPR